MARMPPTSSIVALRRLASGVAAIIVPTPSRVNISSSSAPSRWRLMRCARLTPLSHARIAARQVVLHVRGELAATRGEQRLGVARGQVGEQLPPPVAHAVGLHQEDELVRVQAHRDLRCDLLEREVEDLAGGRIAERRDEHDVAVVEPLLDRVGVDAPHLARQLHVDAVDHAHRLGGDVVAARTRGCARRPSANSRCPSESSASIRLRTWPSASSTQSIVSASVTRRPYA